MNQTIKRVLLGVGGVLGLATLGAGGFVAMQVRAFDASMDKVYDVPLPAVTRSTDPAVLARGQHLAGTIAPCATPDCHGGDLAGGRTIAMGPLGTFNGPNITAGGMGAVYSDGELARLILHGVKKDGRSVRFMPAHEIGWLPDSDVDAVISFVRTAPSSPKPSLGSTLGLLAKILDRQDAIPIDIARRIDHEHRDQAPAPSPTADYGKYLGRLCTGCHGVHLGGGPIPGAPPSMPVPLNLTPHETGLAGWTFEDFDGTMRTGMSKRGRKLDPMMPVDAFGKFDQTEMRALWEHLKTVPPVPFGSR